MKIAFIIPIYPKHYYYIYNLIDLIFQNNIIIDIYLVFSNENDYNVFDKKDKIKKIIIPQIKTFNIVTYKKFFALETLKNDINYDYFIVCDAETTIIPENFTEINILNKILKIYENKIIYAGETNCKKMKDIIKSSTTLIYNGNQLKNITKKYTLYFWWSDLPVYKREHLTDFFYKINYSNINWNHFDHKVYLSYLVLYHNFNIINLTEIIGINWSLESYNTDNIDNLNLLKLNNYGFSYITTNFYRNHINFFMNEGTFLLYHLDR